MPKRIQWTSGAARFGVPSALTVALELRAWRKVNGAGRVTLWLRTTRVHTPNRKPPYMSIEWGVCAVELRAAYSARGYVVATRSVDLPELRFPASNNNSVTMQLARELLESLP